MFHNPNSLLQKTLYRLKIPYVRVRKLCVKFQDGYEPLFIWFQYKHETNPNAIYVMFNVYK